MRQDGNRAGLPSRGARRTAAPVTAEPRWPSGCVQDLREAGAQEKTIPYGLYYEQSCGIALDLRPDVPAAHARPPTAAPAIPPAPPVRQPPAAGASHSPMMQESGAIYEASARGVKTNVKL